MSEGTWSKDEREAADKAISQLKRTINRIDDLLTPEERASLHADLAEMARIRRRALEASASMPVGGSLPAVASVDTQP